MAKVLLIDIDNTIYSERTGLQSEILARANRFIQKKTSLNERESDVLAVGFNEKYGSILSGLIKEYLINPEEYIEYVFNIDVNEFLKPDPSLGNSLMTISERKFAFSDSPEEYIERIIIVLGLMDCFDDIFGRRFFDFNSKFENSIYKKALEELNAEPKDCIIVDDKLENLLVAKEIGMATIWVTEKNHVEIEEIDFSISNIHDINKLPIFLRQDV